MMHKSQDNSDSIRQAELYRQTGIRLWAKGTYACWAALWLFPNLEKEGCKDIYRSRTQFSLSCGIRTNELRIDHQYISVDLKNGFVGELSLSFLPSWEILQTWTILKKEKNQNILEYATEKVSLLRQQRVKMLEKLTALAVDCMTRR